MNRFLIIILLLTTINYSCLNNAEGEIQVISPEEMQQISQLDEVQLVDIRTPEEYKVGHIANFQNIDYQSPNFEKEIEKLDKSKPVIVYCKTGNNSRKCTIKMKQKGFVKVYDLDGGIAKWKFKGFEIKSKP